MKRKPFDQQNKLANEKKQKFDIHQVIFAGGIEELKTALKNGADIYALDDNDNNILHTLASIGWNSGLEYLIHAGYNLKMHERYNKQKLLPIEIAIDQGNESFVSLLIDNGYDTTKMPNRQDYVSRAIEKNREAVAIKIAAEYNITKIIRYKISKLAKDNKMQNLVSFIELKTKYNCNLKNLLKALEDNNSEKITSSIKKANEIFNNIKDGSFKSDTQKSFDKSFTIYGDRSKTAIEFFIEKGVIIKAEYIKNYIEYSGDIALYLLEKTLNQNVQLSNEILFEAARCNKPDFISKLYEHMKNLGQSLNLEIKNIYGKTPLLVASESGSLKVMNLLIRLGAKTGAVDNGGNNLLHLYLSNCTEQITENDYKYAEGILKLVHKGIIDVNESNKEGDSPIFCLSNNLNLNHICYFKDKLIFLGANLECKGNNLINTVHPQSKLASDIKKAKIINDFFKREDYQTTLKNILDNFKTESDFHLFDYRLVNLYHIKSNLKIKHQALNFEEYLQKFINEKENPLPEKLLNLIKNIHEYYTAAKDNLEGIIIRHFYNSMVEQDQSKTSEEKEEQKLIAPVSYRQLKETTEGEFVIEDEKMILVKKFVDSFNELKDLNSYLKNSNLANHIHDIVQKLTNPNDLANVENYFKNYCSINGTNIVLFNLGETTSHFYWPDSINGESNNLGEYKDYLSDHFFDDNNHELNNLGGINDQF